MTAISALLTSLITSAIIFLIIYGVYVYFSRKQGNAVVFFPARILSGRGAPDVTAWGIFQWISELSKVSEEELVGTSGLDAAVYVIFQKTSESYY